MKNNATMKKVVIALSAVLVVAAGGLIALTVYILGQSSREPPQEPIAEAHNYGDGESAELAAELAELQAMLDAILAGQNVEMTGLAEPIYAGEANAAALEFVGHGELAGSLLFNDEGVLTYEIDIRHGIARYMVYINAISGEILSMSRFEDNE